jgi:hypothetical protein
VYKCINGHCIANDYMCSNDVNACGDNGEHIQGCAILDAVIDILKIIGEFSWIIPVLMMFIPLNKIINIFIYSKTSKHVPDLIQICEWNKKKEVEEPQ